MIPGATPIDGGGASELRDLGGGEAEAGSKDLGSSAFGANSTPRSPGRWNSCTGWCCPLQETVGPAVLREAFAPCCHPSVTALLRSPKPLALATPSLSYLRQAGGQRAEMKDKAGWGRMSSATHPFAQGPRHPLVLPHICTFSVVLPELGLLKPLPIGRE